MQYHRMESKNAYDFWDKKIIKIAIEIKNEIVRILKKSPSMDPIEI